MVYWITIMMSLFSHLLTSRHGAFSTLRRQQQQNSLHNIRLLSHSKQTQTQQQQQQSQLQSQDYLFGAKKVTFQETGLNEEIATSLYEIGKEHATVIQAKTIPAILRGDNVVIASETGSGKTLAYLLPLIQQCLEESLQERNDPDYYNINQCYPTTLVLVPNKELATQVLRMANPITEQLASLGHTVHIGALTRNYGRDIWPLRNHHSNNNKDNNNIEEQRVCPSIIVTTPAIVAHFVQGPRVTDTTLFRNIQRLVLDEADMLLQGSYVIDVKKILEGLKKAHRAKQQQQEEEETTATRASSKVPGVQVVLSAATLPSSGLLSTARLVQRLFPTAVWLQSNHHHQHHPQIQQHFVRVPTTTTTTTTARTMSMENATLEGQQQQQWRKFNHARMSLIVNAILQPGSNSTTTTTTTTTTTLSAESINSIPPTMVFANSVEQVNLITASLVNQFHLPAVAYHKQLQPDILEHNLQLFRQSQYPTTTTTGTGTTPPVARVLVCTDLASRGLDLPFVRSVVQAEFASNVCVHQHRIGRCSRAGAEGVATMIVDEDDELLVQAIRGATSGKLVDVDVSKDVNVSEEVDVERKKDISQAFSRRRGLRQRMKKEQRRQQERQQQQEQQPEQEKEDETII